MQCSVFYSTSISVCLGPCYWFHHLRNLLEPSVRSTPVHILYINVPATYSANVACRLITESLIVQCPVTANFASTKARSHYPPFPILDVIPVTQLKILWWNPSSTTIIASITVHISFPYRSTARNTALYIIARAFIGAPIFPITFATTPHICWTFHRFL